jgi:hypothetical protein
MLLLLMVILLSPSLKMWRSTGNIFAFKWLAILFAIDKYSSRARTAISCCKLKVFFLCSIISVKLESLDMLIANLGKGCLFFLDHLPRLH